MAIGLLIPLGIVGSTVATLVDERGDEVCPDQAYECATLEPGEPVVIGLVGAEDPVGAWPLEEVRRALPGHVETHPVVLDVRMPGCSAEAAAQDVRELASDPPDEAPAALVVASACEAAASPMAQILSDSGIALVLLNQVGPIPTDPQYALAPRSFSVGTLPSGPQAIGVTSHLRELVVEAITGVLRDVLDAIGTVMLEDGEELLIPRTPLRDALIERGYPQAG